MNAAAARPQGLPPGAIRRRSSNNQPRRRPVTTVFDGPLTPNLLFISPSRNSSPPREQMRMPRMAFMSSPMGGKVVIPVNGRNASLPAVPVAGNPSTKTYEVDNYGFNGSEGFSRTLCYD